MTSRIAFALAVAMEMAGCSGHAGGNGGGSGKDGFVGGDAAGTLPDGNSTPTGDAAVAATACSAGCADTAVCIDASCRCLPGFSGDGSSCTRDVPPGGLEARTKDDVCAHWATGHQVTATDQFTPGTSGMCDPGVIEPAAVFDAAQRWSMYRWLVGLPAVSVDGSRAADMQQCALVLGYAFRHDLPPDTMCYTPGGGDAASRSMICSVSNATTCMDLYTLESYATDNRLSHRKIVVGTTRDNVAFGVSTGGSCALYGYATVTLPPPPAFVAVPNPGPVPIELTGSTWSIHQTSDAMPLPIGVTTVFDETANVAMTVSQNLEYAGINGFDVKDPIVAGHTYRVTLTDGTNKIEYRTKPVMCP